MVNLISGDIAQEKMTRGSFSVRLTQYCRQRCDLSRDSGIVRAKKYRHPNFAYNMPRKQNPLLQ